MSLQPSTRLGPYEIISAIGAGMGEAYKARDTRLDRIVAIKVLPAEAADERSRSGCLIDGHRAFGQPRGKGFALQTLHNRVVDAVLAADVELAPLSEADYEKIKDALHAMAAMLVRPRNTEKTSAVLDEAEGSGKVATQPDISAPPPALHWRNGAEAFGWRTTG